MNPLQKREREREIGSGEKRKELASKLDCLEEQLAFVKSSRAL